MLSVSHSYIIISLPYLIKILLFGVYSLAHGAKWGESGGFPVGPRLDLYLVAVAEAADELTQCAQANGETLVTALQGTGIEGSIVVLKGEEKKPCKPSWHW